MTGKHAAKAWLGVCLVSLITACSQGGGFSDLDKFMAETRAKPRGHVEPLPEFKAYEAFTYSAADRRSPFEPPIEVQLTMVDEKPVSNVEPDLDRPREVLENFDIKSLQMVGTFRAHRAICLPLLRTAPGEFTGFRPETIWERTTAALWASVKPVLS